MKVGGDAKANNETVNNIETIPAECGRGKRPRLRQALLRPPESKTNDMEEDNGVGGVTREAKDEMGAGDKDEPSQGGLGVSAEGTFIQKENPTQKTPTNQKKMGTPGGMEGRPQGEQGYGQRELGGKQLWDPGSSGAKE